MPVAFKDGDIFSTPGISAFAHGCNCAGAMGKGIAIVFKERWPRMFCEYRQRCRNGTFNPGDVFLWEENKELVFNLATQKTWRTKATLEAVAESLATMAEIAEMKGVTEIALPRVGAGLGGLRWEEVKAIMSELGAVRPVNLLVCENFVEGQSMR